MASGRLTLVLVTHDRKLLEEECDEVTLPGTEGYLGILPAHTALIATLMPGELTYRQGAIAAHVAVSAGFCEVSQDIVTVLVDSAELPEEIDLEKSLEERDEAERAVLLATAETLEAEQFRLAQAEARVQVAKRRP